MHWFNFIWISQIWISLAAVSLYLSLVMAFRNYVFVDIKYIIVIFSGTWTIYSWYHRNLILNWLYAKGIKNTSLMYALWMILATIGGFYIILEKWVFHLLAPAFITIAYIALQPMPYPSMEKRKPVIWKKAISLWLKPVNIATTWILACWPPALPLFHYADTQILAHFLWILGIALFFEEKDKTNSSVQVIAKMSMVSISFIVLLISSTLFYAYSGQWVYLIVGTLCILTAAYFRKKHLQSNWYYYLLLDGFLFIPACIAWYNL